MVLLPPPAFDEASNCAVCGCSFGAFKRRHHCRSCGRSLCKEHSSNQIALPQFGLHAPVRVCKDCFTTTNRTSEPVVSIQADSNGVKYTTPPPSNDVEKITSALYTLDVEESEREEPVRVETVPSTSSAFECTCGMPLCICSAPEPPKTASPPAPQAAGSSSRNRRAASSVSKPAAANSSSSSSFFPSGQINWQEKGQAATRSYDVNGEGLREAIKNGDIDAVKDLLVKGVDPNFTDKQGMSLLHLAAVFNLTQIAFILLDAGASIHARNSQGETPLDCAQTTLQYKLRQRLQDLNAL